MRVTRSRGGAEREQVDTDRKFAGSKRYVAQGFKPGILNEALGSIRTTRMSHVFQSLWVHVTWATKNRQPWLTAALKPALFNQIRHIAETDNIHLDFLNGAYDHVHCLLSLRTTDRIDLIMQQLKGKSARWVNEQELTDFVFGW